MSEIKHTLRERAAIYFGPNNVAPMRGVALGRYRYAFASPDALWLYDEEIGRRGVACNLSNRMRSDLIDALEGF